ncbi:MAG: hypothetical protein AABY22_28815, partial [Nanoarchaeota archaeon]
MAEKYNHKETTAKLASIMDIKKPAPIMEKEDLKQSILANLPKSTICPKHNCSMDVLFEGISESGNPYRAYKCGITKCDQIF